MALDRGQPELALEEAERFLRRVGDGDRFERVTGLELLIRASLATGDLTRARGAAEELSAIAAGVGTYPLGAARAAAGGRVQAA